MSKKQDPTMLAAARDGFAGAPLDHQKHGMLTSSHHSAYIVGEWMRATGRTEPHEVRCGRGDLMHCNGMVLQLNWKFSAKHPSIERVK